MLIYKQRLLLFVKKGWRFKPHRLFWTNKTQTLIYLDSSPAKSNKIHPPWSSFARDRDKNQQTKNKSLPIQRRPTCDLFRGQRCWTKARREQASLCARWSSRVMEGHRRRDVDVDGAGGTWNQPFAQKTIHVLWGERKMSTRTDLRCHRKKKEVSAS